MAWIIPAQTDGYLRNPYHANESSLRLQPVGAERTLTIRSGYVPKRHAALRGILIGISEAGSYFRETAFPRRNQARAESFVNIGDYGGRISMQQASACSSGIYAQLLQFRVLLLGFLQDGDVGIGIFPKSEEVFVRGAPLGFIPVYSND